MEIYLNIAEWAPGIYGVEAAAQAYFGVPASNLSARQSALLAVTLPNPIKRNAANPFQGHAAAGRNHRGSRAGNPAHTSNAFMIEFNFFRFSAKPCHARQF
jgi:membrane carboxypeptidase/penicillin-binding protein PbpC